MRNAITCTRRRRRRRGEGWDARLRRQECCAKVVHVVREDAWIGTTASNEFTAAAAVEVALDRPEIGRCLRARSAVESLRGEVKEDWEQRFLRRLGAVANELVVDRWELAAPSPFAHGQQVLNACGGGRDVRRGRHVGIVEHDAAQARDAARSIH